MSLVFAVELAPIALLGIPSAALVERFGPKRWMVINDAIRAPIVALVPLLHALGHLSFGLILMLAALHGVVLVRLLRVAAPDPARGRRRGRAAPRAGERPRRGDDERHEPPRSRARRRPDRALGAANVMWLDAGFVPRLGRPDRALRARRARACTSRARTRPGSGRGCATCATTGCSRACRSRASCSASCSRCWSRRSRCSPISSTTGNPRVAGLLFAVIGGGQVVGSLLTYRLVTRVRPMRLASFAVIATAAPLWLLVPHSAARGRRRSRSRSAARRSR